VQKNEPEVFSKTYKWLDVKEYLICRCTGEFVMTRDSAYSTFLYDTRKGHEGWSRTLCRMYGVEERHLPDLIECTDVAGTLTERAAAELGLAAGTPVYGGGGDATLIGVGAGAVNTGDTHIYCGTSGWVATITEKQMVDTSSMMAAIVGAQPGLYNYFAEMETAGKSLEWVKDHLALDEIGVCMEKREITGNKEHIYTSIYDYMSEVVASCLPGAGGVIFTPWLHGNRCPFEDANAAGIFFNISLDTGKTEMIRAVVEGACYHLRWMLECQEQKVKAADTIRFCGGGALSPVISQVLADILNRQVEVPAQPQNVGSVGAALTAAVGAGAIGSIEEISGLIKPAATYYPGSCGEEGSAAYERNYQVFKKLYSSNKKLFEQINMR
jgi:xylulokinase